MIFHSQKPVIGQISIMSRSNVTDLVGCEILQNMPNMVPFLGCHGRLFEKINIAIGIGIFMTAAS